MDTLEPSVLYKYRNDSENTAKVISDKQVWLSTAENLNDPLECRTGKIPEEWRRKTIRQMEQGQIMGLIARPPKFTPPETLFSLTPRQTKQWLNKLKKLSHERRIRAVHSLMNDHGLHPTDPKKIFKRLEEQLASVGIFSMSEDANNELMWSHYADSHKGIAFGFSRTSSNLLGNTEHTIPVTYSNEKPTFETGFKQVVTMKTGGKGLMESEARFAFDDPVFRASISTKTCSWSYEKEWRYVEPKSGLFDHPGELQHVVFGLKMPKPRRDFYRDLLRTNGYNFRESQIVLNDQSQLVLVDAV